MYLYFVSFLNTGTSQVIEIYFQARQSTTLLHTANTIAADALAT